MANWRDTILKNFKPKISRLTLVADPDGLLTEEGMLSAIRERGFDLIPFADPIVFRFAYESHDDSGQWYRSYGNENWEFDEHGLNRLRYACINDLPIKESERLYHWPIGRRPDDHPGLSALGL